MRYKLILVSVGAVLALSLVVAAVVHVALSSTNQGVSPGPVPPDALPVVVHSQAPVYHATDPLLITVTNQTNQQIVFWDHQSGCSVLAIEFRKGSQWLMADECTLGAHSIRASLDPGQSLIVTIHAPEKGWRAGIYRAVLSYAFSPPTRPGASMISSTFSVL